MSINVQTGAPANLLAAIKKSIDDKKIATWSYDREGDFTHTPDQWKEHAWLRPTITSGRLLLRIIAPKGVNVSKADYAVYHGRFIEMLLTHFDDTFTSAVASALVADGDIVGPS